MPEDIPETGDDVKLGLNRVKFFGSHGPHLGVRVAGALHRQAWLQQHKFRNASSLRDAAGASAVAAPDVEHGAASRRHFRDYQLIDPIQIRLALLRQTREHRCDPIIGRHGIR